MRKRKIPFLKCCEWLYLGAMAVGILYMVQGFRQEELARVIGFPEAEGLLRLITAGTFAAQFLIMWSDEADYRVQMWLGIFALNAVAGFFLMRNLEQPVIFWSYVGLEAACIVAAAVVYAIRYFKVLKGILVLAQAVALTVLAIQELSLPGWCVCIMMVGFLIFLVELASGERKEVLGLLPLFAAVMLLLGVLPRSAEPLDWSGVQQAWTNLKEKAQMLVLDIQYLFQGEKEFSFSFAGYGEEGGLGGSVSDSGQEQLHITGAATKNPLYLTGSVYEVYTGEGWESAKETTEVGPQTEKVGIQKALDQSIHAQRGDLVSSVQIAVEYRFIKTEDFFHELNTTNLYFPKDKAKFENGSPWTLRSAEGKDFNYWLNYVEFNEKSEEIQAILRQQAWREDAVWDEEIIEQGETAREMALGLPDTLPERVYELADTIAADADNDYDRMKAFERYLEEFTYTKKPPQCPEGQEFTDYFLFESKSGYCTYFATALAVLGRCEGIPTRYVSGFMTPKTCKGRHANVSVTGNQAHAWTEAYIEHVGWVRFDATPGYGEVQEDRWKPIQVTDTGQMDKPDIEEVEATESEVSGETDAQKKSAGWYAKTLLEAAGLLLAGCLLAVLGIVGLRKLLWRRKYADADIPEKVRIQLKCLLKLGRLQGEPIAEGETLQAYQRRTQKIKDMAEYSFADACDLYEGVRFGAKSVSPEEMQKLVTYTKNVERAYLAECGVLKKIVYFII